MLIPLLNERPERLFRQGFKAYGNESIAKKVSWTTPKVSIPIIFPL